MEDNSDDFGVDERACSGDKVLHDICRVIDSRNWVLGEGIVVSASNILIHFENTFDSIHQLFSRFEPVLKKVSPNITEDVIQKEYIAVIMYTLNSLNTQTLPPIQLWKLLFSYKSGKNWDNILLLVELCLCAPYSNAILERFFSQMKVVKTDWLNRLTDENLTALLYIKSKGRRSKIFTATTVPELLTCGTIKS